MSHRKFKKGIKNSFEQSGWDFLTKSNVKFGYEESRLPYTLSKFYVPDFTVNRKSGPLFIEFKGYLRPEDQIKMRAVRETNPQLDIRFVFQNASKLIRKGAKLTYGQWASKYGFLWAEGGIPKSWLK